MGDQLIRDAEAQQHALVLATEVVLRRDVELGRGDIPIDDTIAAQACQDDVHRRRNGMQTCQFYVQHE